jgi:hypothetical protein
VLSAIAHSDDFDVVATVGTAMAEVEDDRGHPRGPGLPGPYPVARAFPPGRARRPLRLLLRRLLLNRPPGGCRARRPPGRASCSRPPRTGR